MPRLGTFSIPSLVVAATCVAASAQAQDAPTSAGGTRSGGLPPRAFEIGARAGLGYGFGKALQPASGQSGRLVDSGNFTVPLWLDLGVRVHRYFYVGAFGQYQYVDPRRGVDSFCQHSRDECSVFTLMGGLMGRVHFLPSTKPDPWVGVGFAYEYLRDRWTEGPAERVASYRGFQFFNLQAGADFELGSGFKVGPYAAFALTQFTRADVRLTGAGPLSQSFEGAIADIGETTLHGWMSLGVRGMVGL